MTVNFDEYKELEPLDIELSRDQLSYNKRQDILQETDGEVFYGSRDPVSLPTSPEDQVRALNMENLYGRLESLSFRFYRTVKLWWIFLESNDISDPFEMPLGRVIKIPAKASIYGNAIDV